MQRDELEAWLRLTLTPQLGRESVRKLLAALASPEAVLGAGPAAWRRIAGEHAAAALASAPEDFERMLATAWDWLRAEAQAPHRIVALGDPLYPPALLQTADPPLLLYVLGRAQLLATPSVAIVGSRNPTPQGLDNARAFAAHLSRAGHAVVSGLALGIDGAAHEGALDGAAGTIAVIGTGIDRVYPKRHLELARRIAAHGALVSEFGLGMPPLAANFPQRNRIIAGLSLGTLVVEAALQSGSLITARLAAEAGREVFAIPGSIHAPQSRGCHQLLKQGAKLVDGAQDILEELSPGAPRAAPAEPPAAPTGRDGDALLDALGHDPVSLDALVARTGWPTEMLNARLLELELDGAVARLPGQLFQRRMAA
jgi:DNA processing protein